MGLRQIPDPNIWGVCQPFQGSSASTSALKDRFSLLQSRLLIKRQRLGRGTVLSDDEHWEICMHVSRINIQLAQFRSQIRLRLFTSPHQRYQMWYGLPEAHALKLQYDSWTQWEKLMRRQKSRVHKRLTSRDTFKRLFGTSETHMGLLSTGGEWGIMFSKMLDEYCPGHINQDLRWDPILGRWDRVIITQPAQLFPRSEEAFMNAIFTGKGEVDEIYSPKNGLFTHTDIKEALDKGYIAIVPDIDLQPIEPWRRFNHAEFRKVKTWEEKHVKDYKVIVIDKQHKEVMQQSIDSFPKKKDDIRLIDLHNRKLNFRTEFRPRERYIWWMFLNAILHTHWRDKLRAPHVQQELRKYTRYWGRDGKYVKKNQLLGIANELGRDVASLVTDGLGEVDGERISFEAVHALVEAAAVKSVKEINDSLQNGDADDSDDTEYGEMMLFD